MRQKNGLLLSPRMVTASVNTTLVVTKKTVVRSRPTKRNPKRDNHQNDLVMPDSDQHGFVEHRRLSIKNVPLHLSDDERSGPVMPAAVAHETESTSRKPRPTQPLTQVDKNQAIRVVSRIYSHNSSDSPPQNILEHFQVSSTIYSDTWVDS